jgi:hypothetical protein
MEQDELMDALLQQSIENPDQIELDDAIKAMEGLSEVTIELTNN